MVFNMDAIGKARKHVEAAIRERGVEPDDHQVSATEGGVAWALRFGSAAVMIALNLGEEGRDGRMRIVSPIVKLPDDPSPEVFRELLELNGTKLPGVAFGLVGDEVVLVSERSLRGLDRSEVEETLGLIGHYADEYDDLLVDDFGGKRVCDIR
jgi:hypothetical protein